MSNTTWYIILGIINIPAYIFLGKILFSDLEGFWEAICYWFKPDIWSWVSGEGFEDMLAEMKLGVFLILCGGPVYGEFYFISEYLLKS